MLQSTIGEAVHDGCELQAVDIAAKEYLFEGAPDTLKAGRVSFALENKGVEDHEMVLFKRAADATEDIDAVLASRRRLPSLDLPARHLRSA